MGKSHSEPRATGNVPLQTRGEHTYDGTISVALAARHSDPYSGADLVLWWPSLAAPPACETGTTLIWACLSSAGVRGALLRPLRQIPLDNIAPAARCRSRYALLSL